MQIKSKSAKEVKKIAIMEWIDVDLDDALIAIQAAQAMSRQHRKDVAILCDLQTVFVDDVRGRKILEIVRYGE